METIAKFTELCTNYLSIGGPLAGFLLIVLESIIPALPLSIFIALNVNAYGLIYGIILSWIATTTGCFLCYTFFYKISEKLSRKLLNRKVVKQIDKSLETFKSIELSNLVLIITLPFTPAFLINILAGISKVTKEKFIIAILIGKLFMTIFWGYIGKSFLESMTDIKTVTYILITLTLAYIISKIIGKKMNIE